MSTVALSYVWKHYRYKGGAKVVLLAIADNANDEGVAWPSVETLAEKAELTKRQTQRILDRLEADGTVIIYNRVMDDKPTHHFSNVYVICMEGVEAKLPELTGELRRRVVTSASLGSDIGVTTPSDIGVTRVVTSASSEPSFEPPVNEPPVNPESGAGAPPPPPVKPPKPKRERKPKEPSPEELDGIRQLPLVKAFTDAFTANDLMPPIVEKGWAAWANQIQSNGFTADQVRSLVESKLYAGKTDYQFRYVVADIAGFVNGKRPAPRKSVATSTEPSRYDQPTPPALYRKPAAAKASV